jgi:multidrug efflux pump subunit AcrA (membrane-fusion protein)
MEEINDGLKIYSEEVRDVLSDPPKTILKWGNAILLGFVCVLLLLSWFIQYPDIIASSITITTTIPPEKLVAKVSGKIEKILVADKTIVAENTPLAIIQNSANYEAVFLLKKILDTININNKKSVFPFELLKNKQFGDIESAFATFYTAYQADDLNTSFQPFQIEYDAQNSENSQLKERLLILQQQKSINESELTVQKNDLDRNEILFEKGIIASQEFDNRKLSYFQAEKNYKNLLTSISQIKSSLIDNTRNSKGSKINGTKENVTLQSNKTQAFYQLKKVVKDWEFNYVFKSAFAGKVTFLQIWNQNQNITSGDNAFSIIPTVGKGYVGKVKALAQNSGKIKLNQAVNIKLFNFPDREFGILVGKVKNISLTPDNQGNLLIDIALPDTLETSYHKVIPFQQEMTGSAEIVTEDLRLLERLLYQFRDVFRR